MAKQHVAEQETLGEAMNKTEFFFEKNGRMLSYVFLGLLVLAALVFGYRALVVSPRAEKAAKFYDKAVAAADNNLTAPMYLRKAGLAEQAQGNGAKAAAYYERILTSYPASMDARDAEKLLGSIK